jgi:selenide,water dikinase
VLRQLPALSPDPNLLIGAATGDDAGVYRLDRNRALVQTVDFFTPIVDDCFTYGQIAAANSLSDVYAMGGKPLTALNLLGVPPVVMSPKAIADILRGGLKKAREAGCAIVGGHTMRNPEPLYGLAVTGLVSPRRIIANTQARPGDLLVLTKPLGNGIVTTGIKLGLTPPALAQRAIRAMCQLNSVGADLGRRGLVRAGTDVTGFGFLGHLSAICRASGVAAEVEADALPTLGDKLVELIRKDCISGGTRQNLKAAEAFTDWGHSTAERKILLTDAQTSGGLLLCVAPRRLRAVMQLLREARTPCATVVGRIIRGTQPNIRIVRATSRR